MANLTGTFYASGLHKGVRDRAAQSLEMLHNKLSLEKRKFTPHSAAVSRLQNILDKEEAIKRRQELTLMVMTKEDRKEDVLLPNTESMLSLLNQYKDMADHFENENAFLKDSLQYVRNSALDAMDESERMSRQFKEALQEGIELQKKDIDSSSEFEVEAGVDFIPAPKSPIKVDNSTSTEDKRCVSVAVQTDDILQDCLIPENSTARITDGTLEILEDEIDKIRKVHETRLNHLQSLLQSTRQELDDSQAEVFQLRNQLRSQEVLLEKRTEPTLCVKCAKNNALVTVSHSRGQLKVIDRLQREKEELVETVDKQKKKLTEMWKRELNSIKEVQRSCDMAQQIQLDKYELAVQCKQLEEKLKMQQERNTKYLKDFKGKSEQRRQHNNTQYTKEREELSKKVNELTELLAAEKIRVERSTRDKVEMKSEADFLRKKVLSAEEALSEATEEARHAQIDAAKKLTYSEQENEVLKRKLKKLENEWKQEAERLHSLLEDSQRKSKETREKLEKSRRELLTATEKLNEVQAELLELKRQLSTVENEYIDFIKKNDVKTQQKDQKLSIIIHNAENKYHVTKEELGKLLEQQIEIANRFKHECQRLSEKLLADEKDFSEKIMSLKNDREQLNKVVSKMEEEKAQNDLKLKAIDHENRELVRQLQQSEDQGLIYNEKLISLHTKQNHLLKERQLLCDEIEFLRAQISAPYGEEGKAIEINADG